MTRLPAQRLQLGGEPVDLAQPGFHRLPPGWGQEPRGVNAVVFDVTAVKLFR
jgi:hypothetical protein